LITLSLHICAYWVPSWNFTLRLTTCFKYNYQISHSSFSRVRKLGYMGVLHGYKYHTTKRKPILHLFHNFGPWNKWNKPIKSKLRFVELFWWNFWKKPRPFF
jgi:hypothetical protein